MGGRRPLIQIKAWLRPKHLDRMTRLPRHRSMGEKQRDRASGQERLGYAAEKPFLQA